MRVLVLGSGGREHALAWAVAQGRSVEDVLCAPGSDAISRDARIVPVDLSDPDAIVELARRERSDLVVVGPEAPLVAGVADRLEAAGIVVFGPSAAAARLEGSKSFAKDFMARHGVPSAAYRVFDDADEAERYVGKEDRPLVVKADGLAGGKGVTVCSDAAEAKQAIAEAMRDERFGSAGSRVVIEDRLVGEEASYYVLCDGDRFVAMDAAQDHKRALDGDRGENTGGMGAYSPTPVITPQVESKIQERVVLPTLEGMRAEGYPYKGVLYVGLMIVGGEPFVIEFNVRFGDPETQPLLFRLQSDLARWLDASARGQLAELKDEELCFGDPAVCVVLASEGYPRSYGSGFEIEGLDGFDEDEDVKVFHAGTCYEDGAWRTAGGRVLGVTARGRSVAEARKRAYAAVERIRFKGAHFRSDIAARGIAR